jgi:hypothetical protein
VLVSSDLARHERSKGDDGLRTNYWYLQRVDGSEDLAVIGREIKGSGGHYNYNSVSIVVVRVHVSMHQRTLLLAR